MTPARALGAALLALAAVTLPAGAAAQQPAPATGAAADTARVLTVAAFTRRVVAHHPAARQARLSADVAREEQRVARGAFDPTLAAAWDRKTFGSVEYYDYVTAALTVPTPLGVDVKLGYERAEGRYVSPDRRTPGSGLVTAGISIPLGQRMLTDERRTAIAVARGLRDAAEAERDAAANRVVLVATRDYARWYEAVRRADVAREGEALAAFRLGAVRRRVAAGEAAPLDTVEALLEANRRLVQRVEAEQAALVARLAAEAHLWDARGLPDTLPAGAVPSDALEGAPGPDDAAVARLVAAVARDHPEVRRAEARLAQAAAQRRLAVQQLLPLGAAEVSALAGDGGFPALGADALDDDVKTTLSVRSPLLYLRERGRAAAAGLRVEQQRLEVDRARRDVAVAAAGAAGEVRAVAASIDAQRAAVAQARLLLRGEQLRFEAGESTLFLVNARERALLDEALRLAGLEARAFAARAELAAALGWWTAAAGAPR